MTIIELLRMNAARKSELDADKATMTKAANAIELLLTACEDCLENRGDWGALMWDAVVKANRSPA